MLFVRPKKFLLRGLGLAAPKQGGNVQGECSIATSRIIAPMHIKSLTWIGLNINLPLLDCRDVVVVDWNPLIIFVRLCSTPDNMPLWLCRFASAPLSIEVFEDQFRVGFSCSLQNLCQAGELSDYVQSVHNVQDGRRTAFKNRSQQASFLSLHENCKTYRNWVRTAVEYTSKCGISKITFIWNPRCKSVPRAPFWRTVGVAGSKE